MSMDKYVKLEKVGEGAYGKVYKARCKSSGKIIALKKAKLDVDVDYGMPVSSMREVSLLLRLSESEYVVRLLNAETIEKNGKVRMYLAFEYLDMDLHKFIYKHNYGRQLPPRTIKRFMYQLCKGLTHCHGLAIMHRDLKPANLLVDRENDRVKIADLGLGRHFPVPIPPNCTHEILTLCYRAPEVLLGDSEYSVAVDVWSLGCIFAEMVASDILFYGDSEIGQLFKIFQFLGTPTEEAWPGVTKLRDWNKRFPQWKVEEPFAKFEAVLEEEGVDLLSKMLTYNPNKRISAIRALDHPYFDDLDKSSC